MKHNCDRCKRNEGIGDFGFDKVCIYLCNTCANEWRELKIIDLKRADWKNYVNQQLTNFINKSVKEKVQFT
jgi:hypothetical protein